MTTSNPRIILKKAIENSSQNEFWAGFRTKAASRPQTILFPEGSDPRVLSAVSYLHKNRIARPVLSGRSDEIHRVAASNGFDIAGIEIWDPAQDSRTEAYVEQLFERRKSKGLSLDEARKLVGDPLYFACMALNEKRAHGVVSGAVRTTADTVRAAFGSLGLAPGASTIFGLFIMECPHAAGGIKRLAFVDSAVSPRPSARALAAVGMEAAKFFEKFVRELPRVAYLSFSTRGSASDESVELIRQAVSIVRQKAPALAVDGELQGDAALIEDIAQQKGAGDSPVAGRSNVFVFPDLNAANISYKLVQHLGGSRAVGPFLLGLSAPMTDLSRGCNDEDIVDAAAVVSLMERTS